jgi:membrane fusion protein (multidrug efflux system)
MSISARRSSNLTVDWMGARRAAAAAIAAGLMVASLACGGDGASAENAARGGGDAAEGPPPLPTMAVAVEPVSRGSIATYYGATASLDPDKQADILARTAGVVERLLAEEGDRVAAGDVLLDLEDDEYRNRVTLAEADVEQQRLRFERAEKMLSEGLTSTEAYETAQRDLSAAEASLELAQLQLSYTNVRAPFSGRVVRRLVDLGQTVSNGTPLFTLADMSRLLARVFVPAKEFRSIQPDQPVQLVVTSTGDRLTGRTDHHQNALLIPRIAVVSERGQRTVFVADGDTARQRTVDVAFEDDQHSEIVAGLDEGELVVVQGQRALRDGQPINVLGRLDLDDDPEAAAATSDSTAPPAG